jgi:ribonuclease III
LIKRIINKIRFISLTKNEPYFILRTLLGFSPKESGYYQLALLHRSSGKRNINGIIIDNERLEFLGDAILSAVVSDYLYQKFPTKKEGFLTNLRSKIVQREYLDQLALEMGLDKLMFAHNKHIPSQYAVHIYGNALEALIGAIYLDQGYKKCQQFLAKQVIEKKINLNEIVKKEYNFKSKLIEWAQKRKYIIIFVVNNYEVNKELNKTTFYTSVLIEGIEVGEGSGLNKKESQQKAARNALHSIKKKDILALIETKKKERIEIENPSTTESV